MGSKVPKAEPEGVIDCYWTPQTSYVDGNAHTYYLKVSM
jgi:hypothetical protein